MITNEQKQEIIWWIDDNISEFSGTIFFADLKMMRYKYIYKDLSRADYLVDVMYLRALRNLLKNDYPTYNKKKSAEKC